MHGPRNSARSGEIAPLARLAIVAGEDLLAAVIFSPRQTCISMFQFLDKEEVRDLEGTYLQTGTCSVQSVTVVTNTLVAVFLPPDQLNKNKTHVPENVSSEVGCTVVHSHEETCYY